MPDKPVKEEWLIVCGVFVSRLLIPECDSHVMSLHGGGGGRACRLNKHFLERNDPGFEWSSSDKRVSSARCGGIVGCSTRAKPHLARIELSEMAAGGIYAEGRGVGTTISKPSSRNIELPMTKTPEWMQRSKPERNGYMVLVVAAWDWPWCKDWHRRSRRRRRGIV